MNSVLPVAALPVLVLLGCTGDPAAEEASAGPRTPSGDSGHGTGGEGAGTGGSDAVTDSGDGGGGFDTGGEDTGQNYGRWGDVCSLPIFGMTIMCSFGGIGRVAKAGLRL